MPIVLLILAILVFLILIWLATYSFLTKDSLQLILQFEELRSIIIKSLDKSHKEEAKELLDKCHDYLKSLLEAQKKLDLLDGMSASVKNITGENTTFDKSKIKRKIAKDLDLFFSGLVRISTATGFDDRNSLQGLEEFTKYLEDHQNILLDLHSNSWDEESFVLMEETEEVLK